jgi:RNA polymerase sigma-70 factor (ECF subfamily)
LRNLSPDYRDVLVLRHKRGLNGKQIAEILGIAEGTVWSRLSRALEELRALMQEHPPQGGARR